MTTANQPTNNPTNITAPIAKIQGPYHSLSQPQRPNMSTNSVAEP